MTAFQSMILSGQGLPETPPGGSVERRLKSRMRRLRQLVDLIPTSAPLSRGAEQAHTMKVDYRLLV